MVPRILGNMVLIRLVLVFGTVAGIASCDSGTSEAVDYGSVVAFDSTRLRIATGRDTVSVLVEVARTSAQKTQGLMERQSLPDSTGMLFVYEENQAPDAGFWMYRTRIPLDIAFADSAGVIVSVLRMEPCSARLAAGCPTYAPGAEYQYALEVNSGFFARHGIKVGSLIVLADIAQGKRPGQ
jgi:uncharacterized protein